MHVFRFSLAHRSMLKLGREVKDRRMGKIKLKKLFLSRFSLVFWQFLDFSQSEPLIKLKLMIKSEHLLIDFAICLPSFYTDYYLIISKDNNLLTNLVLGQ